ncbi:nickel pincer cofactor biosynthesis protein LarB [Desulfovibrio sp. ZJ369]|uniref:nickel pincer cofactor biosynthesis protein LarB n=1 Tax=Desulfovibrio sp. ZJ369 TaxID=2709793 RepID=UPI0013EA8FE8|nr:nickel pincer cofactor biosynthesis protein LarB [Desulfovibrio sp. ZJ369]
MQKSSIRHILDLVAQGRLDADEALERMSFETARDALHGLDLDPQRELRSGLGEVVFAQGKSDEVLLAAVEGLRPHGPVLVSRVAAAQDRLLRAHFPQGLSWPQARLFVVGDAPRLKANMTPPWPRQGEIMVVSAGAADIPVALEAFGALSFWDHDCGCVTDVGVAGLHRLAPHLDALRKARAIIAVAGMEGALPGVLAGLVPCPVVAVPTSVGYGVGAHGFAALSTMLCTCVPGVAVVNIDNGFGAAAFAVKMPGKQ